MNPINAVVFKSTDGRYFAFVRKHPAAAVSAGDMDTLLKRLKLALSDVVKQENFNYIVFWPSSFFRVTSAPFESPDTT